MTAISSNGCEDKITLPNYLWIGNDKIDAIADKMEGCANLKVYFNANLTHNWTPLSITWDFGDGTNGTGESPTHTYTRAG